MRGEDGEREVVSNLSLTLARGETLCIAGESGSGKSMTALAIMQLLPQPAARISSGTIRSLATPIWQPSTSARCAAFAATASP